MTSTPHDPRVWQRPDDTAVSPIRHASASLVDPEDDLPSPNYGGDFETTTIPHYGSSGSMGSATGYSLLNDSAPLPYVEPRSVTAMDGSGPVEVGADDFVDERVRAAGRRGTQDFGLLLLRTVVGLTLIAHGLQKVFGLGGGDGPAGFRSALSELGYQHADLLTYLAAGTQVVAGALLVLGLFTPVAGAVALAYLVNSLLASVAVQRDAGYVGFFLPNGNEYEIMLITVVATIVLAGPGRWGFDGGRGWARRPFVGSAAALLLGIGGGIAVWVLLNGSNPLA